MRARALPVTDRVDRDGEAVVLVGADVVRLSALACAVLALCRDWTDSQAVTRELVARFGPPPDGTDPGQAALVTLTTLRDSGLLELG